MFSKRYEDRLREWNIFRQQLENDSDPLGTVVRQYSNAPPVAIQVDPYDQSSWLSPWELLKENVYCKFSKVLAICYTLQLTERFMDETFEITIYTDNKESSVWYLLRMNDWIIGYDSDKPVSISQLPDHLQSQLVYSMPRLQ
jgi:hypothetical protein